MDIDDDGIEQLGDGETGWVRRTEAVDLNSEGVGSAIGYERLRAQYDELLGEFSSCQTSSRHL